MRRLLFIGVFSVFFGLVSTSADEEPLQGFTRESSVAERHWEAKFRAIPSPQNQREYMLRLSAHPHHVGSPTSRNGHISIAQGMLHEKIVALDAQAIAANPTEPILFPQPLRLLVEHMILAHHGKLEFGSPKLPRPRE